LKKFAQILKKFEYTRCEQTITKGKNRMKKKQRIALDVLRKRIAEKFGDKTMTIADVTAVARQELKYNVCRMAALFELRKEDFRRFHDTGFMPPYFISAFRRYFNLKEELIND